MDRNFVKFHKIQTRPKIIPQPLTLIDGTPAQGGDITEEVEMEIQVKGFLKEKIVFCQGLT